MTVTLRDPFPVDAIKVKPQSVNSDKTKGLVTYYIDARLVAERLNDVVGNDAWQDEYKVISGPQEGTPVECRLTVNGVTKCDVGQVHPGELDDKTWKSAYSDAFKRAAVKFGVGAYLYDSPNIWAEVKTGHNGKVQGFSDNGRAYALQRYEAWVSNGSGGAPSPAAGKLSAPGDPSSPGAADGKGAAAHRSSAAPDTFTIPFGKHKGKTIAAIDEEDPGWLDWFLQNGNKEDIKEKITAHRSSREVEAELESTFSGGSFSDPDDIPFDRTVS